jgi:hypothetical protein
MVERAEEGRARERVKRIILKKAEEEEDDRREAGKKFAGRSFKRLETGAQSVGVRSALCRTTLVLEEKEKGKEYEQGEEGRSVGWDGKG